jgi:molecular chaperone DnaK (HSP70)
MVVAGIDIGSTHGCVGVFHNGKVNIIANDQGFRTTPAYVTFEGDEVIIGDTAVNKLSSHAENTIFHLKRVLGKNHEEIVDRDYIQEWSFKIVKSEDGAVHAATSRNGDAHHVTPVDFVSLLIKNLKDLAEDFTGESVDNVVLSIPAHATEKQKELLQAAADKAGVNVLTFISEPLAAAIAYGLDDSAKSAHPELVLVLDIGGATHDVTLLNADKGLFEIVATSGKDNLGGEDFTKALFEHCAKAFQRKTKLDVKDNKKASSRLRIACETAKRTLSTQAHVNIEIDSLMEGEDLSLKLTRPRFEELISDYVTSALKEVDALLESANVEKEDIDHVILVGGSSRIPLLQNAVKKHFDGKTTHLHLSPDEVVAHGATIEASLRADLANFESPKKALNHVNVTPLTLSVALANGSVTEVIHRDTVLPATATETFTTSQDNQTAIFLQVYEGERVMAKDNTLLASLSVAGIAPAPKGEAEIEVTFTVSTKGVLTIAAVEQAAGKKTLEVKNDPKRLTANDVAAIIKKAEDAADEDDAYLDELEAAEDDEEEEEVEDVVVPGAAAVLAPTEDLD